LVARAGLAPPARLLFAGHVGQRWALAVATQPALGTARPQPADHAHLHLSDLSAGRARNFRPGLTERHLDSGIRGLRENPCNQNTPDGIRAGNPAPSSTAVGAGSVAGAPGVGSVGAWDAAEARLLQPGQMRLHAAGTGRGRHLLEYFERLRHKATVRPARRRARATRRPDRPVRRDGLLEDRQRVVLPISLLQRLCEIEGSHGRWGTAGQPVDRLDRARPVLRTGVRD
jgi:hypothetical protein